jgi:hypothetical protein
MASINLFGWEFKKKEDTEQKKSVSSFTPQENNDGAVLIAAGSGYGTYVDLDGTVRTEAELVTKYREMSLHPECDAAVDEIINESISVDEEEIVNINLDNIPGLSESIKNSVKEEFQHCLQLLDFKTHAYDIYRRWYIDGRLYYHVLIDKLNPREGIQELRYIDPRKIRKIREIAKKRTDSPNPSEPMAITKTINEYFVYNDRGFNYGNKVVGPSTTGLKIAKDAIVHIVSGLTDNQGTMVLSYLHKAIKALNQLRTLEDALVIYRLARAPERRIWYIDVGNLPKMKAEQYVRDIMTKHKNRLIYDASTGEMRDDRKFMTMLEDYWLPRREGGKGTEVDTLPGGQTLGQMDDVLYFQKKFLQSLNVPVSRLNSDALFSVGRATEITRDELKFVKFVTRLRFRFSSLFHEVLRRQLVLKGVMSMEDWDRIAYNVKFDYAEDQYFTELKKAEIEQNRINLARSFQDMAGKYFPHVWIRKNVLQQTDDQIKEYDKEIAAEAASGDPRWINPLILQNEQMADMMTQQKMAEFQANDQQNQANALAAQGLGPDGQPLGPSPEEADKQEQIRQALEFVKQYKETPKANHSMQDQAQYNSAIQVIAKNKDYMKQHAITPETVSLSRTNQEKAKSPQTQEMPQPQKPPQQK